MAKSANILRTPKNIHLDLLSPTYDTDFESGQIYINIDNDKLITGLNTLNLKVFKCNICPHNHHDNICFNSHYLTSSYANAQGIS